MSILYFFLCISTSQILRIEKYYLLFIAWHCFDANNSYLFASGLGEKPSRANTLATPYHLYAYLVCTLMSSDHRSTTQCVISQFALNSCDEMFWIANKKKKKTSKKIKRNKNIVGVCHLPRICWNGICLPSLLLHHFFEEVEGNFNLPHSCETAECNYTHMNDSETDFIRLKLKFINSKVTSASALLAIKSKYCRTFCPVKIHSNTKSDNIAWKAMREWIDAHSHDITCTSSVVQKAADSG